MATIKFSVQTFAHISHAIKDGAGKFVPCNLYGDFKDEFAALGSIGIGGSEAALALVGAPICTHRPFFIVLKLEDPDGYLSEHPISITAAVLLRRPCGTVGLWFAMLSHLSDTYEDALRSAIEEALEGNLVGGETVDVFQIDEQHEGITLQ